MRLRGSSIWTRCPGSQVGNRCKKSMRQDLHMIDPAKPSGFSATRERRCFIFRPMQREPFGLTLSMVKRTEKPGALIIRRGLRFPMMDPSCPSLPTTVNLRVSIGMKSSETQVGYLRTTNSHAIALTLHIRRLLDNAVLRDVASRDVDARKPGAGTPQLFLHTRCAAARELGHGFVRSRSSDCWNAFATND